MQAGETSGISDDFLSPLEFSINPERVAPLLRRLVTPTRTRARIYDREAALLLDTRALYSRGDILRLDLPERGTPVAGERVQRACSREGPSLFGAFGELSRSAGRSSSSIWRVPGGS